MSPSMKLIVTLVNDDDDGCAADADADADAGVGSYVGRSQRKNAESDAHFPIFWKLSRRISYSGFLIQMLTLFVTPMLMPMVKLMLILGQMEPVMVEVQRPSREEPRVEGRMVKVGFLDCKILGFKI